MNNKAGTHAVHKSGRGKGSRSHKEPVLDIPQRGRGYQTEDLIELSRSQGRGRGGQAISPEFRPSNMREAAKSDIETSKAYGLRSSSLISGKSA